MKYVIDDTTLTGLANSIREKTGETGTIKVQDMSTKVEAIPTAIKEYTGHYDTNGLKQIGWTDEDIQYAQENGVTWNEEDDEYFKLTNEDILETEVTNMRFAKKSTDNTTYKNSNNLIGVPKTTLSSTSTENMFSNCWSLISVPNYDTTNLTRTLSMFNNCYSLNKIPEFNFKNVSIMGSTFCGCYSLKKAPNLDTSNATSMSSMFYNCHSLQYIPCYNTNKVTNLSSFVGQCYSLKVFPKLNTSKVTTFNSMFYSCTSLFVVPELDGSSVTNISNMFNGCYSLVDFKGIKNLGIKYGTTTSAAYSYYRLELSQCSKLRHSSLISILNNLYDIASRGCKAQNVAVGSINLAKLTDEEKAIATTKGWTLS